MLSRRWLWNRKNKPFKVLILFLKFIDYDFDEDGFASCEEDEETLKIRS